MAKQIRSVRFDEQLLELFSGYSSLLNEIFGYKLSFSALVNEAFADFLQDLTEHWYYAMKENSIAEPLPSGQLKQYKFTEAQIAKMDELRQKAFILSESAQHEQIDG